MPVSQLILIKVTGEASVQPNEACQKNGSGYGRSLDSQTVLECS